MTEQEWMACTDPTQMVGLVDGKASNRKLRLFTVACFRRVRRLFKTKDTRRAFEVAERAAEGQASRAEIRDVLGRIIPGKYVSNVYSSHQPYFWPIANSLRTILGSRPNLLQIIFGLRYAVYNSGPAGYSPAACQARYAARDAEASFQAALLRDIFGNPFRPAGIVPSWLRWNNQTIPRISQSIYEEQAFDRLPILGDALEEAGCANADLLGHCRGSGPHVRGCWAVDLLLAKK
jgi:hypothetical protein